METSKTHRESAHPHLLIIEDEPDLRMLMKRHFTTKGWIVDEAENLENALGRLEGLPQEVLITLDLHLPDGIGFTFLIKLRELGRTNPVVVCSAYSNLEEEAYRYGANGFISKPLPFSLLDETLLSLIQPNP